MSIYYFHFRVFAQGRVADHHHQQLLIDSVSFITMSRPQTPHGISPRGSYVNLLEGRENEAPAFSPSKIEKERLRAEAEVKASLLREKDEDRKKEEAPAAVASPGMSLCIGSIAV